MHKYEQRNIWINIKLEIIEINADQFIDLAQKIKM